MTASIVGWAHTPFGKFDAETVEGLVVKVANEALLDAGISADDVDEIVLGHFNAGFSPQDFTASLVLQVDAQADQAVDTGTDDEIEEQAQIDFRAGMLPHRGQVWLQREIIDGVAEEDGDQVFEPSPPAGAKKCGAHQSRQFK